MAAALEIEPQMDVRCQRSLDAGPAEVVQRRTTTWTDDNVDTGQCNDGNYDRALKEVLLFHRQEIFTLFRNSHSLLLFLLNTGNGRSGNFENRLIRTSNKETRIAHGCDGANYAACSNNAVPGLQLRNRLLQFSLSFLLRPNQKDIEDAYDQEHRE